MEDIEDIGKQDVVRVHPITIMSLMKKEDIFTLSSEKLKHLIPELGRFNARYGAPWCPRASSGRKSSEKRRQGVSPSLFVCFSAPVFRNLLNRWLLGDSCILIRRVMVWLRDGASGVTPGTQAVYVRTWGCSHNNSDGEFMAVHIYLILIFIGQLANYGYEITGDKEKADLWVLNSCTVKAPSQ
eukprot:970585-Amorphochlora_amoeboformis.AAC.1